MTKGQNLLEIERLSVGFGRPGERQFVVNELDLRVAPGEKVAVVGESGSGKSVTALSVLRLHERDQSEYHGRILLQGQDLLGLPEKRVRAVRGRDVAMIFQEPMTSLNPVYTIGDQLTEPLRAHEGLEKEAARKRVVELLERVGISEPRRRLDAYPHMLSGGQRQRVMIAMALACRPKLLIADEPTTALDVTIQRQILELLENLQQEFHMAVMLITHDLNMVRHFAERVYVMQHGRVVEDAGVEALFSRPQHPYTQALLGAEPERLVAEDDAQAISRQGPLMEGKGIRCIFPVKSGFFRRTIGEVRAVDDVDITLHPGETVGVVGESGSGKTTLGMCLLRLQEADGEIRFQDRRIDGLGQRRLRPLRREFQVVFQDPYSSLSPRMTVEQIIGEGLRLHFPHLGKAERRERIVEGLREVGLEEAMMWRYPHEFSGGQRQRIAVARVMVLEPKVVLLDEPTSALDVSVQKQVLRLLRDLQRRYKVSYLFISHDLKVVRAVSHRMLVMREGKVVEAGETEALFNQPRHEYTRTLLDAALFRSG